MKVDKLVRKNVKKLQPYSSAREEFQGEANTWLDANENPFETGYNRYPDPFQSELKKEIAQWKGIATDRIFLGNGSDEVIDLLIRAFCEPGKNEVLIMPPTYGMYEVCAAINNVKTIQVPLKKDFIIDVKKVLAKVKSRKVKLTFICSPNNPTGNAIDKDTIQAICKAANGLVVVDEAYIDFAPDKSMLGSLEKWPNLVILQTFSKAWGLAGVRLGMAFTNPQVVEVLNKIKPPYNVNVITQRIALENLQQRETRQAMVKELISERENLVSALGKLKMVKTVYPSDANFLLIKFNDARKVYAALLKQGIVVRDRTKAVPYTLRITVGTPQENSKLLTALKALDN